MLGAIQNSPGQGCEQFNFDLSSALRKTLDFRAPSNLDYWSILFCRAKVHGHPTRHKIGHLVWLIKKAALISSMYRW